jgi:hypothetical protein
MATGRDLHADAVLLGAWGMFGPPMTGGGSNMKISLVLRLYDPNTKKLLWGASRTEPSRFSIFHPIDSTNQQLEKITQEMLAGIPQ